MKKTIKNTFLFLTVIVLVGYAVISVQAQQNSLLVQTTSNTNADIVVQKFINQINIVSSVRVETTLFSNEVFRSFVDWSRPIPEEEKGRTNPFAPIN